MGLRDVLFGKKKLSEPKTDRLFALATAAVTLDTELGLKPAGAGAIAFKPQSSGEFRSAFDDVDQLVEAVAQQCGSEVERKSDEYGYDWVTVRDPDLDKRVARLELQVLARDAEVEDLQMKLEDTRAEVVRAMAKLQSVASRAQAASAMAEAEVALQTMKAGASQDPPEADQVNRLVRQAANAFDRTNYGGALYLANQAKTLALSYRGRLAGWDERPPRTPLESVDEIDGVLVTIEAEDRREQL